MKLSETIIPFQYNVLVVEKRMNECDGHYVQVRLYNQFNKEGTMWLWWDEDFIEEQAAIELYEFVVSKLNSYPYTTTLTKNLKQSFKDMVFSEIGSVLFRSEERLRERIVKVLPLIQSNKGLEYLYNRAKEIEDVDDYMTAHQIMMALLLIVEPNSFLSLGLKQEIIKLSEEINRTYSQTEIEFFTHFMKSAIEHHSYDYIELVHPDRFPECYDRKGNYLTEEEIKEAHVLARGYF